MYFRIELKKFSSPTNTNKMSEKIIIRNGNTNDGRLELSDNGDTQAKAGTKIKWKIMDGSNVASIVDITPKSKSDFEIFSVHPKKDGSKFKAKIKHDAIDYDVCEYNIHWKAKDNSETIHIHDPKISIEPSFAPTPRSFIIPLLLVGLSLVAFKFFQHKNHKKRR